MNGIIVIPGCHNARRCPLYKNLISPLWCLCPQLFRKEA